jgi:hypothetical protein
VTNDWGLLLPAQNGWALGVIAAAAFAGAFIKGVTTLGLALFAIPLISLFLDVQTAILSLFVSKFLSDIAMLAHSKKVLPWRLSRRVAGFIVVGLVSIPLATLLLAKARGPWMYLCLAASVLLFVGFQLKPGGPAGTRREGRRWKWGFGFAAGASQGLTGAAGPYAAMYLYGLGLTTEEFVFLSSVIYLLFDFSQFGSILYTRLYDPARIFYALMTIVPVMGGTYLGIWFRGRLDDRQFRKLVLGLLLVSAGALIFRAARMA